MHLYMHNTVFSFISSYPYKIIFLFLSERFFFFLQPRHASAFGASGGSSDGDAWS